MHKIINSDKLAHKEKINTEEAILISQFRKQVLNKFIEELDSVLRYPASNEKAKPLKDALNLLNVELIYQIADLQTYFIGINEWTEFLDLKNALDNLRSYFNDDKFKNINAENYLKDNKEDIAKFCVAIRQLNQKGQIHILKKLHERETFPEVVKEALLYDLSKRSEPPKKEN